MCVCVCVCVCGREMYICVGVVQCSNQLFCLTTSTHQRVYFCGTYKPPTCLLPRHIEPTNVSISVAPLAVFILPPNGLNPPMRLPLWRHYQLSFFILLIASTHLRVSFFWLRHFLLSLPHVDGTDVAVMCSFFSITFRWVVAVAENGPIIRDCLLYTSPSPRDRHASRMPSSA